MKKPLLTVLFALLIANSLFAIDFYNGSYKDALTKAKTENKLLFLYFTAKWCGPCQYMQQYIFPDEALSIYVAQNYIALKIDIDTPEGKLLYNKAHQPKGPMGVPAFIIMNSNEEVLKKTAGGMKLSQLQDFLLKDKDGVAIYKVLTDSIASLQISSNKKKPSFFNKLMFNSMASKWKPGIKLGANLMGFKTLPKDKNLTMGYEFGLFFDRAFQSKNYKNFWNISRYTFQPGLMLTSKAGDLINNGTSHRINIHYLQLDLSNHYRIKGLYGFELAASPYLAMALWGKNRTEQAEHNLLFGQDFSQMDYGVKLGLSKPLGSFAAYLGYNLGLKNINLTKNNTVYHRGLYASFALIMGK